MGKTIAVGDLHAPFIHKDKRRLLLEAIKRERPKNVVQIGDAYDFFSFSRFRRAISILPADEITQGREQLEEFWKAVRRAAPGASCYQLLGNHDERPLDRLLEKAPEYLPLVERSIKDLFAFPGVHTIGSYRDDLLLDGVVYEHGWLSGVGKHMRYNNRPTVFGHTHKAHTIIEPVRDNDLWEMNVGYLADPRHEALAYTKKRYTGWRHAYGVVDGGYPRLMVL